MAKDILDAVYGCIIGGAVGDALGAPVEGWHWKRIRSAYPGGRITEMEPGKRGNTGTLYGGTTHYNFGTYDGPITPPGGVTDDTTLRHYLCYAIVRKGGRVTPDDYAQVWLEKLNPNRLWINERVTLWKLRMGMNPWDTGKGNPPAGVASMSIAPIGIVNAGNPEQAYQDGFVIGSINQDNADREGAATLAAGIAAAFLPGATYQSVIDVMLEYSSFVIKRSLLLTMDLAYESKSIDEFAEKFYTRMLDWKWPNLHWDREVMFSGSSVELVPITAAILYLTRGDVNQGIIEAASLGRDNDTTAALVGAIAGTLHGASAIRQDWIETVEKGNADFFRELEGDENANFLAMSNRLVDVLKNEAIMARQRTDLLTSLINGA
ncbi:MAG: ADP-ribosylglycohydrolase family protein [Chloroflexi bacterium]|nr:ADP-ribosylglycohydrolase family protein [Chloroflexota bacterium]